MRAERPRDLDRGRADAARRRVHEHLAPAPSRTWRVSGTYAVRNVSRNDAPSSKLAASGSGHELRLVDRGQLRVAAAAAGSAITRVPSSSSPAISEPSTTGSCGICG